GLPRDVGIQGCASVHDPLGARGLVFEEEADAFFGAQVLADAVSEGLDRRKNVLNLPEVRSQIEEFLVVGHIARQSFAQLLTLLGRAGLLHAAQVSKALGENSGMIRFPLRDHLNSGIDAFGFAATDPPVEGLGSACLARAGAIEELKDRLTLGSVVFAEGDEAAMTVAGYAAVLEIPDLSLKSGLIDDSAAVGTQQLFEFEIAVHVIDLLGRIKRSFNPRP